MRVCLAQAEAVEWLRMSRRPAVDWHEEKNPKWSSTASEQVDCCCCQRTLPSPQSRPSHSPSSSSASSQSWWSQRHLPRKKQQGHSHLLSLRTSLASNSRHRYIRCIATRTRGPTLRDTALHRSTSPLPSQNETTTMQRIPTEHICDTNLVRFWRELSLYTYVGHVPPGSSTVATWHFPLLNAQVHQLFRLPRISTISTPAAQFHHGVDTIIIMHSSVSVQR